MKRIAILISVLVALAATTSAQASTPPLTTQLIGTPGVDAQLAITPPAGWTIDGASSDAPQCSGSEFGPEDFENHTGTNTVTFFLLDAGANPGDATCNVTTHVTHFMIKHFTGFTRKTGMRNASRSSGAYITGGNCNTGPDGLGQGGRLTTCLFAHASFGYRLVKPRNRKLVSITHRVTPGIEPCRNHSWRITHKRGTRTWHATFTHGSRGGFSQCDIKSVTLHYKWSKRVPVTVTVHGTSAGTYSP
jgi:hypothetical protein